MTHMLFDRADLIADGDKIKQNAVLALVASRGVDMTPETFNALVIEAFMVNNYVVRCKILEQVAEDLDMGRLTSERIGQAMDYLVKRLDGAAARLGSMVELIEECKTPGPRH